MIMKLSSIKILLIHFRDKKDPMAKHEQDCFIRHCDIKPEQIVPFNVIYNRPDKNTLNHFDILMLGGSGDFSVLDKERSWLDTTSDFILKADL